MKKMWKITWLSGMVVIFVILFLLFVGVSVNKPGKDYNKGHNAIWIGHEWVGEWNSDQEIRDLVGDLRRMGIDTVFVHSGPFENDGGIEVGAYQYAGDFLKRARDIDENIQYQAWLGQIRKNIDLADSQVRENILEQVRILTSYVGFDGIHFDIEPVWDEDIDFIKLLEESRGVLGEKVISVALAEFIPRQLIWMMQKFHEFNNHNTQVNYRNVGKWADQIVVMTYDTGFESQWFYEWFVKEQLIWVTNLYDEKEVFIGIPVYDEEKESFDPLVENAETGMNGIVSGMNNIRSKEANFAGAAIYSYWTLSEEEIEIYENIWLK
jgi:hypothetical protein